MLRSFEVLDLTPNTGKINKLLPPSTSHAGPLGSEDPSNQHTATLTMVFAESFRRSYSTVGNSLVGLPCGRRGTWGRCKDQEKTHFPKIKA